MNASLPADGDSPGSPAHVLVLNSGSSSLKYQLIDMTSGRRLATGLVERIGERTSRLVHTPQREGRERRERTGRIADHQAALRDVAERQPRSPIELSALPDVTPEQAETYGEEMVEVVMGAIAAGRSTAESPPYVAAGLPDEEARPYQYR